MIGDRARVIVRPMRGEDAPAIVDMAHALAAAVGDPPPRLSAHDLIRDGLGPERWFDCLVAERDGAPVGYVLACKGYEAHTGNKRLWLGDLYVRPEARGNGVARAMMAGIARHAAALGCDAVCWELWRANEAGAAFYQRLGAELVGDIVLMRSPAAELAALKP